MRGLIAVAIATAPNATHTAAANPSLMYMPSLVSKRVP